MVSGKAYRMKKSRSHMTKLNTIPIKEFKTAEAFETWLIKNHENSNGLWLKIFKKDSGKKTVSYAGALDVALCYGWIDGQKQAYDEQAWLQKFCPRSAKSIWSKINIGHVNRLIQEGQMTPAGLKEVEAAKADGRWAAAYDSSADATVPPEFVKELARNPKAKQFYATLNKANLFSIAYRLQTAKRPETKSKRIKLIIDMLARGEKFH
jgi:uncharacterized protein YdeI (YjbR/CyaY-like superfamily)